MRALIGNRQNEPFDRLVEAFVSGATRLAANGLVRGSRALILSGLLREYADPAVILVHDRATALALQADLAFFLREDDGSPTARLYLYPAYDVAPFESISPHQAIGAQRMACLEAVAAKRRPIIIAPVEAVMNRVIPRAVFTAGRQSVKLPDLVDRDELLRDLLNIGYRIVPLVEEIGEVAVRGNIIDIFPPGIDDPVRIELFGDEVESLRSFNSANQISHGALRRVDLFPCGEVHLGRENAERFALRIKELADAQDVPKPRRDRLAEEVANHIAFPGIEFFTPLLHERLGTFFDHFSGTGLAVLIEPADVESAADAFQEKCLSRHERAREAGKICVAPDDLYLDAAALKEAMSGLRQLGLGYEAYLEGARSFSFATGNHEGLRDKILARAADAHMLSPLAEQVQAWKENEGRVLLVCRTLGAAERLEQLLKPYHLMAKVQPETPFHAALSAGQGLFQIPILLGDLSTGFIIPGLGLAVVVEEDIFGERRRSDAYTKPKGELISSFSDLAEGDFVVHLKHGVGIYRGLLHLEFADVPGEFVHLEYAGGDKLYVPVDRLNALGRYIGAGAAPKIDRLGALLWDKAKRGARAAAQKLAKALLTLYATRVSMPGYAFAPPEELYREFEATFPYEETIDQELAIRDSISDLTSPHPSDRLICGDVGFGKTEVAMRAAFLAVLGGKQVAVLVPTTTLAFQHYNTFKSRMDPFGVRVEMLSRFVAPRDRKKFVKELFERKIDILIGTHALLGKSIRFADLGLLIVDEEQHFGVAQKEKIKALAVDIDVLTFTATPIPRTLHMSLAGLRDLSIINTPPEDRLAIRTFVTRYDEDTIRESLERELSRGGQAFFIHNRVRTIDTVADRLRRLVPQARIAVGHGQMDEKRIEQLMIDFSRQQFDVLVCTTIVESGLDFPLANTILIDRADALGLAQLYQLRGRVGRSKRRAYCYLLIPAEGALSPDARKRLAVLRTFTELGSGYKIAARDLEIRGAGNLLGAEQSGHITAVGFDLYTKLLEEEIRRLKGEEVVEQFECEVAVRVPAYLPEDYVRDVHLRLHLYKRIADAENQEEIGRLREELTDRFGHPPEQVENLLAIVSLRRKAEKLRIKKVEAGADSIAFEFDDSTPLTPGQMVRLVAEQPGVFSLTPDGKLYEKIKDDASRNILEVLTEGLQRIAGYAR